MRCSTYSLGPCSSEPHSKKHIVWNAINVNFWILLIVFGFPSKLSNSRIKTCFREEKKFAGPLNNYISRFLDLLLNNSRFLVHLQLDIIDFHWLESQKYTHTHKDSRPLADIWSLSRDNYFCNTNVFGMFG